MFFATAQWHQFHCQRQFNDPPQYGFIPADLPARQKRRTKERLAKPDRQSAFTSNRRTIPVGEISINREAAINRDSSRLNKIERID
ncbi:hypothetical protein [Burkholderia sp. AU45388]|uniref:hypothetical protein n=1 Tax=Burkholderia sp. AU45388 TaxID=3059206 RepID=UPI00264D3E97|nr:hypothetical protein [Burkholderia sp. AU45388]MDN7426873.1 hypothetical protein [Burkholderia sp. AU45388]